MAVLAVVLLWLLTAWAQCTDAHSQCHSDDECCSPAADSTSTTCCGSASQGLVLLVDAVACIAGQCYRGALACWSHRDQPLCNVYDAASSTDTTWSACRERTRQRLYASVYGSTSPAHIAALEGRTESLELLLEEGADVNAQLSDGRALLHVAALSTDGEEIVSFLIANNADWRLVNASGATPLHHYAAFGRHHGAALLLASGADPNARSLPDGNTPLHNAALGQHVHTAQLLLGFGADPGLRNARGLTPFDLGLFDLAQPPTHMTT